MHTVPKCLASWRALLGPVSLARAEIWPWLSREALNVRVQQAIITNLDPLNRSNLLHAPVWALWSEIGFWPRLENRETVTHWDRGKRARAAGFFAYFDQDKHIRIVSVEFCLLHAYWVSRERSQ